jgi:hypothetical protein
LGTNNRLNGQGYQKGKNKSANLWSFYTGMPVIISNTMPFLRNAALYDLFEAAEEL